MPVAVTFLKPDASLLLSRITAFDAATVHAVMPSNVSNSASVKTALPAVKPVPVTIPLDVTAPDTVKTTAELKDMVSDAAALEAVLKLSFVALEEELK